MSDAEQTPGGAVDELGPMVDMAAEANEALGGAVREMRRQAIMPMVVRSAVVGLVLFWLSTKFPWVRWVFGLWAVFTAFMFGVLLLLPTIIKSRVRTMTSGVREAMDLAGDAGAFGMAEEEIADLEHTEPVPLEEQLAELEELGVRLAEGRTIDDVLGRLDREAFEDEPYALLLYTLGTPVADGSALCERAVMLDAQCIEGPDSYAHLVSQFGRAAGKADRVAELEASMEPGAMKARLSFVLDGEARLLEPEVSDGWVDENVLKEIVDAFAEDSHGFYGILNGRFSAVVYLDRDDAVDFADLVPGEVVEIA